MLKKKITSDLNTFVKHSTSKGGWVIFLGSIFVLLIGVIYLGLFVIKVLFVLKYGRMQRTGQILF
jgi:hypothetical protein